MSFIGFPKNNGQNRKLQHRTRVGSRVLRKAMRHHLAWPGYRPGPERPPSWCNRSYGATPATWGIDAAPAWVSIKRGRAGLADERYLARFARNPCAPRGRAILDLIARVYRRAGARIFALVFGPHCFNHGRPLQCDAMRQRFADLP